MSVTIEADLENGRLSGPEVAQLPKSARVQVVVLGPIIERPEFGTRTSVPIKMTKDAFAPLDDQELSRWGLS